MLKVVHDTQKDVTSRARVGDGWVQGRNGGWLRPIAKGDKTRAGYKKPHALTEVLQAARRASPAAIATLVEHLNHPDGRVAVTAANLILERAWGRPPQAPLEEPRDRPVINLSALTDAELAVLFKLVTSERLRATGADPSVVEPMADPAPPAQ